MNKSLNITAFFLLVDFQDVWNIKECVKNYPICVKSKRLYLLLSIWENKPAERNTEIFKALYI